MIHITPVYDLEDEEEDEDDEDGIGQFVGHLDVVLLGVVVRQHLAGGDLAEHHPVPAILPGAPLSPPPTRAGWRAPRPGCWKPRQEPSLARPGTSRGRLKVKIRNCATEIQI